MRENRTIGEHDEHLLIGSAAWLEAREGRIARYENVASINTEIARQIRRLDERPAERVTAHEETDTGKQLHHAFVNHAEAAQAMEDLWRESEAQHRHYLACEVGGLAVEEVATEEGQSTHAIERSLRRARAFLRWRILDPFA